KPLSGRGVASTILLRLVKTASPGCCSSGAQVAKAAGWRRDEWSGWPVANDLVATTTASSIMGLVGRRRHAMNMRLFFLLSLVVTTGLLSFSALSQQRPARVALVIGNASYPDASTPLATTLRDARTLADEFRRSEFDVDLKENAGKEDMRAAIDAFTGKIRTGMTALFYFNGFGI